MDSANSGSMQSSSNSGDEEFDSRSESISFFLNLPPPQPPPPTSHHHLPHPSSSLLDPLSSYLNSLQRPPPANPNHIGFDMTWSTALRPPSSLLNPNLTDLGGLITSSSSNPPPITAPGRSTPYSGNTSLMVQPPNPPDQPAAAAARASKKRSRASRRAPTTVLTTDTTNFRAMVQEFTGIPTTPFAASRCPRPRYDLFHAAAPPYLLRPFAHKVHATSLAPFSSSPLVSSLMADAIASTTRTSATNASTHMTNTTNNSYQLPSADLQIPNLLNMQSPTFTFQSLLQSQTTPKDSSPTMPDFGARPQGLSDYVTGGLGSFIATAGMHRQAGGLSGWDDGLEPEGGDRDL